MNSENIVETFMSVFSEAYKKVGKYSVEESKNKEEYFETYWNNYKNETKEYVYNLFNNINKGGMFSITALSCSQSEPNKNLKIIKLDNNKYYIISNEFRIHAKFNTKSTLENDDINDLLSIDIMFPFNLGELKNKWSGIKIDII